MLFKVEASGQLKKMQLSSHPECALFAQEINHDDDTIHVSYQVPKEAVAPPAPEQKTVLRVPLRPANFQQLEKVDVNLHQSLVVAYRMGSEYDDWFSACFGFKVMLVYIGDGRRPVLGTFSPKSSKQIQQQSNSSSWYSTLTSYVTGGNQQEEEEEEPDWLTFTDCAPFLVTTEASLQNVRARLASGDVDMYKFRPNIVVDGETQWDEDFWAELRIRSSNNSTTTKTLTIALTKICNRCTSLNVDYDTGRPALGERGTVLKKLMSDRRVDPGLKYNPAFGRYGFLTSPSTTATTAAAASHDDDDNVAATVGVGDCVDVTERVAERQAWDWPINDMRAARYYYDNNNQRQQQKV